MCDIDIGVMTWVEVQEGRTAMRRKAFSREMGTTCANVVRVMELTAIQLGTTLLGDSLFTYVMVRRCMNVHES
jgi:hypothetical protein